MTVDKALKQAIRRRAAETGERYTEARRALLAANDERPPNAEVGRQSENLIERGYAELAGTSHAAFRSALGPLTAAVGPAAGDELVEWSRIPLVVVPGRDLVPPAAAVQRIERRGKGPTSMIADDEFDDYTPIDSVSVPASPAYALLDVDTGADLLNVNPEDALEQIEARGRSPLTLEEGIALVTQFPESLVKNACFSLPGSRRGDRRVTALWLSKGAPKLGWCFAGAPHTWLGSASCARRLGC